MIIAIAKKKKKTGRESREELLYTLVYLLINRCPLFALKMQGKRSLHIGTNKFQSYATKHESVHWK